MRKIGSGICQGHKELILSLLKDAHQSCSTVRPLARMAAVRHSAAMPGTTLSSAEMIDRLVGFDTTSRNSNLALIDFVRDYLDAWGIRSELVFDAERRKANLYATIGPGDRGGIVLSGHTDVVPVDGQPWESDPFALKETDGRLYGRGTCDMKSFVAVALALVPEFLARGLKTPVHFAFSYDEEVGCLGVRELLAELRERPVKPRGCIVGEPTLMRPVIAHKGRKSMRCHIHGKEAHSALTHEGVNAVEVAAELVTYLRGMARRKREQGPFDPDFAPPYTTIHTGVLKGGTALNIVPRDCELEFEFRNIPGDDLETLAAEVRRYAETTLLPEMRRVNAATGIVFEEINTTRGLVTSPDEEIVHLAQRLSGANALGKVSYGTEAGLFQAEDIPTVICGPGSMEQGHKPNEFVSLEQVRACEAFMRRLMDHLAH